MKLGPRLAEIARLVPKGCVAADIGTDHAYLPVHLITNNICPKVIATEKSKDSLEKAKNNVELLNLSAKIQLRLGDGLAALSKRDIVDVIILAGMGGRTICRIFLEGKSKIPAKSFFIMQPMGDSSLVRRFLVANDFSLPWESLVQEKGRFYEVIFARPGREIIEDPFLLEIGPALVKNKHPLLASYLLSRIEECRQIQDKIFNKQGMKHERYNYLERKRLKLKEVLQSVTQGTGCN